VSNVMTDEIINEISKVTVINQIKSQVIGRNMGINSHVLTALV